MDCTICLEEMKPGEICTLDTCSHAFDTRCLEQWVQKSNTCPLCRARFLQYNIGENNWKSVAVLRNTNQEDETDSEPETLFCYVCQSDREGEFLLCDGNNSACERVCHLACAGFDRVPEGNWFCSSCSQQIIHNNNINEESDISQEWQEFEMITSQGATLTGSSITKLMQKIEKANRFPSRQYYLRYLSELLKRNAGSPELYGRLIDSGLLYYFRAWLELSLRHNSVEESRFRIELLYQIKEIKIKATYNHIRESRLNRALLACARNPCDSLKTRRMAEQLIEYFCHLSPVPIPLPELPELTRDRETTRTSLVHKRPKLRKS